MRGSVCRVDAYVRPIVSYNGGLVPIAAQYYYTNTVAMRPP